MAAVLDGLDRTLSQTLHPWTVDSPNPLRIYCKWDTAIYIYGHLSADNPRGAGEIDRDQLAAALHRLTDVCRTNRDSVWIAAGDVLVDVGKEKGGFVGVGFWDEVCGPDGAVIGGGSDK